MIRLLLVSALVAVFAVGCGTSQPVKPEASGDTTTSPVAQGDVTGFYLVEGTLPAEFADIDHLHLSMWDADDPEKPAPLNGLIRSKRKAADDHRLVGPTLKGKDLTFSTTVVDGVSYSFAGTFERLADFSAEQPDAEEVILRGRLTKSRDGATAGETDVSFTYTLGD